MIGYRGECFIIFNIIFVTLTNAAALETPIKIHNIPYHSDDVSTKKPPSETIQNPKLNQIASPKYETKSDKYLVPRIRSIIGESNVIKMALAVAKNPVRIAANVSDELRIASPLGRTRLIRHQTNELAKASR
ncbi:MAG: hypothetical protein KUG71_13670 [Porticoccaceae bacterium]|nr:hypothetical protein [Porticoccaceae bacterium]